MGTISKNFSYREFEASETAERRHICNVITTARVRDALKALTLNILQPLRDFTGSPIRINSGYRCPELNAVPEIKGAPTSQHVKGEAADIVSDTLNPLELARRIVTLGLPFDQLILYPTFVHVSHKLEGAQRGQVLYNRRYNGPKI